jgi:hypothetical protein
MIDTHTCRLWTPFGWHFAEDLWVGQRVISFNADRGCCEYDTIESIEIKRMQTSGYGLEFSSMRQVLTPDHPLLHWRADTKVLQRVPIKDLFMRRFNSGGRSSILVSMLFEPYKRTQDIEDIKWSARIAATMSRHRRATIYDRDMLRELGGYEAQVWTDTFFHWNKKLPAKNWMACVPLTNLELRDIVLSTASRAGRGARYMLVPTGPRMYVTHSSFAYPTSDYNWFKRPINGDVFNVTTKNGSILAATNKGTHLLACNQE